MTPPRAFTVVPRRTVPDPLLSLCRFLSEVHGCLSHESRDDWSIHPSIEIPISNANVLNARRKQVWPRVYDRSRDFWIRLQSKLWKVYSRVIKRARLKTERTTFLSLSLLSLQYLKFFESVHVCICNIRTLENWVCDFHDYSRFVVDLMDIWSL